MKLQYIVTCALSLISPALSLPAPDNGVALAAPLAARAEKKWQACGPPTEVFSENKGIRVTGRYCVRTGGDYARLGLEVQKIEQLIRGWVAGGPTKWDLLRGPMKIRLAGKAQINDRTYDFDQRFSGVKSGSGIMDFDNAWPGNQGDSLKVESTFQGVGPVHSQDPKWWIRASFNWKLGSIPPLK